jgi:hypothetical protein
MAGRLEETSCANLQQCKLLHITLAGHPRRSSKEGLTRSPRCTSHVTWLKKSVTRGAASPSFLPAENYLQCDEAVHRKNTKALKYLHSRDPKARLEHPSGLFRPCGPAPFEIDPSLMCLCVGGVAVIGSNVRWGMAHPSHVHAVQLSVPRERAQIGEDGT